MTGKEPTRKSVEVYVSPGADMDTIQAAYDAIYEQMDLYQNGRVTETNEFLSHTLEKAKNMKARLILISLLVLLICPLVWFFSQILFFAKRKSEMDALRCFGAVEREIRGVYLLSGVYMAVASIFMTLLLAYSASGILFLLCNRVAAALGMGDGTRYAFYMSTPALISCIGLSMLFGFLSAMVPYLLYRSRRKRELRTGIIEMPKAE